jgi:hypothetical protein
MLIMGDTADEWISERLKLQSFIGNFIVFLG